MREHQPGTESLKARAAGFRMAKFCLRTQQ